LQERQNKRDVIKVLRKKTPSLRTEHLEKCTCKTVFFLCFPENKRNIAFFFGIFAFLSCFFILWVLYYDIIGFVKQLNKCGIIMGNLKKKRRKKIAKHKRKKQLKSLRHKNKK